jgi:hypothetical protein
MRLTVASATHVSRLVAGSCLCRRSSGRMGEPSACGPILRRRRDQTQRLSDVANGAARMVIDPAFTVAEVDKRVFGSFVEHNSGGAVPPRVRA